MPQSSGLDRRALLAGAAASMTIPSTAFASPSLRHRQVYGFPSGFFFGVGTSAYQIEGAFRDDGKGESIWDRFVLTPGKIAGGATGQMACDSYNRLAQDIDLLKGIGVNSYRFSIAWTRIQPEGCGSAIPKGLDYYKRLTDALLEAGIRPFPTLYHWDLPQALEDRGGWPARETADRFVDYAVILADALGDRISNWSLFNEPATFTQVGYLDGMFAPGRQDARAFLRATHVVNLAQGQAFQAMKAHRPRLQIGGAYDVSPFFPKTQSAEDKTAAERMHQFQNLWFIRPALTGSYPEGILTPEKANDILDLRPGDDKRVRAPLDFIGLNYYSQRHASFAPDYRDVPGLKATADWATGDHDKTDFGWDIYPEGLYEIAQKISVAAPGVPLEITENGASYNASPQADGRVDDPARIVYIDAHLKQVSRAIKDGVPIRGYHAWSLMDNFEWTSGYTQRFGLAYVDFVTQNRKLKQSGEWYRDFIAAQVRLAKGKK